MSLANVLKLQILENESLANELKSNQFHFSARA
jgi:hypothetical protein